MFAEYQEGGLDRPEQASPNDQFKILLAEDHHDDGKKYTSHFEQFQVNSFLVLVCRFSVNYFCKIQTNAL